MSFQSLEGGRGDQEPLAVVGLERPEPEQPPGQD